MARSRSCPGALTGAQFGARLQAKLPPNVSERVLAVVFATVGVLVIALRDVGRVDHREGWCRL